MNLKWKVLAIIYATEFLLIVGFLYVFGLLDTTKVVSEVVVGLIVGIIVGFASVFIGWRITREFEKKDITGNLLSEIRVNQKRLQPLAKVLDSNIETSEEDKFPDELVFESRIYLASLGKLGLLDTEKRDNVVTYYSELNHIEEGYTKLGIHGYPIDALGYFELREVGKSVISKLGWHEIEESLRHTKNVYDLGEGLIISFNGEPDTETYIVDGGNKSLKDHLRTKPHEIRKL